MAADALAPYIARTSAAIRSQGISSHDIDYVVYIGPGLTWGRVLSTCIISMNSNDIKCKYSVSPIYRGRVYRGIGYIAVACWTPFFWRPRAWYFSRNRGNTLDPIRGRQFFAKSAHRDSLCSRFAGDNFSRNQLWPTCQCGLEHMLCDGQPSSAEHWHLHCIAE